jgi:glycosyltransferase involved in cell wall biosynthesis
MDYKFSLVIPTLGSFKELEEFFESLTVQTYKKFEVIVVDQNNGDGVEGIIKKFDNILEIKYIKNSIKGLSLNRNIALSYLSGDIIAFADDDCIYRQDTLSYAKMMFDTDDTMGFLTFNWEDKETGKKWFGTGLPRLIDYRSLYNSGCSFTLFVKKIGEFTFRFDEQLGVGAKFGAGEESDMMLWLLSRGYKGIYNGQYSIFHPNKLQNYDAKRAYNYGLGFGAFHKKAALKYRRYFYLWRYLIYVLRNIGALLIVKQKKYYLAALKGKLQGFIQYHS